MADRDINDVVSDKVPDSHLSQSPTTFSFVCTQFGHIIWAYVQRKFNTPTQSQHGPCFKGGGLHDHLDPKMPWLELSTPNDS